MRLPSTVLILLWAGVCLAESETDFAQNYHVFKWQIVDGLPQNSVRFVTQTADGYLWLATPDALARFDGRQFKVFNRSDIPDLRDGSIRCLYGDRVGRLWIGTHERFLCYSRGEFTTYAPPATAKMGEFNGVAEDATGALFALGWLGLCRTETGPARLVPLLNAKGQNGGPDVVADVRGRLWVAGGNSIYLLENGEWTLRATLPFIIASLFVDLDQTIWCGLIGGSIVQVGSVVRGIYRKLHVHSLSAAVAKAVQEKIF